MFSPGIRNQFTKLVGGHRDKGEGSAALCALIDEIGDSLDVVHRVTGHVAVALRAVNRGLEVVGLGDSFAFDWHVGGLLSRGRFKSGVFMHHFLLYMLNISTGQE